MTRCILYYQNIGTTILWTHTKDDTLILPHSVILMLRGTCRRWGDMCDLRILVKWHSLASNMITTEALSSGICWWQFMDWGSTPKANSGQVKYFEPPLWPRTLTFVTWKWCTIHRNFMSCICATHEAHPSNKHVTTERRHPESKVLGANMGPIWGRQDPGGPHVGLINLAIWADTKVWTNRVTLKICTPEVSSVMKVCYTFHEDQLFKHGMNRGTDIWSDNRQTDEGDCKAASCKKICLNYLCPFFNLPYNCVWFMIQ